VDQPSSERWLIVPTDLGGKPRPQVQTHITLVLLCYLLRQFVMLFANHSFSKATIELVSFL
jgi:hypothetical protein